MKNISPQKILLAISAIFLIAIFFKFAQLLSFPDSSIVLQKGLLVKIQPKETVTQKFTADRNGLAKVEALLRSPGIKYENGDKMEMKLLEENCEKIIFTGELKLLFLNSNNLYEFNFPRIDDSKNKTYCLSATFQNKKANAKSIQFFTAGDQENQPLSIRPVYKNSNIFENLSELNQRISQYKPWFLKHYFLWFISFGFILLSILIIVTLIII